MSVNRDMKNFRLMKKETVRSPSGAKKEVWKESGNITASIRKKNESRVLSSERYREASHTGLTYRKDIKAFSFRIADGDVIYDIIDCNTESRLTNLLLKVVDSNV